MLRLFLLFITCFTTPLGAAVIEIDGKDYNCTKKSTELFYCANGPDIILVKKGFSSFMAFSKDGNEKPMLLKVSKVIDGIKILYSVNSSSNISFGSFENGLLSHYDQNNINETIISNLKGVEDPVARTIYLLAEEQLAQNNKAQLQKVSLSINGSGETLQCIRGESAKGHSLITPASKDKCDYYKCMGMGNEQVLAYLPNPMESYKPPYVIRMADGQAEMVKDDFTVRDDKRLPILNVAKDTPIKVEDFKDLPSDSRQDLEPIDPKFFIPSKYQKSSSSFNNLTSIDSDRTDDSELKCQGSEVKSLLDLKKKIGSEMRDHIASADIVEYLKMHNGNIHSHYVDRYKGQSLGCEYESKILDKSVLSHLDYLKKISNATQDKKYLSITEVQELFKKAQAMADIPFGYKYDGCYARAHLMARRFEAEGIPTQKVWIKGDLYVPGTDISWNYHVAPVIDVKEQDGAIRKYVIDPSLNDKAIPIDDWVASMKSHGKGQIMKTTYPFPANSADFQRTTVALSSSDPYGPVDQHDLDEETKMASAAQTLKEFSSSLKGSK